MFNSPISNQPVAVIGQKQLLREAPISTPQKELFPLTALSINPESDASVPQPDTRVIRPPTWLRRPTVAEVRAAYPPAAAADGVGAQVGLYCHIESDDTLSQCVSNDPPNGYGFGASLLPLTQRFRIRQKTIDGKVAENTIVAISVRFDPQDGANSVRALWTGAPNAVDVQAALIPSPGKPLNAGGRGVMRCTVSAGLLTDCRQVGDRGDPFSRAAVRLAPKFAIDSKFANGKATEGAIFDVPVMFDPPGKKSGPPVLENPVRFIRAPSNAQKNAIFPSAARDHNVTTLAVTESCVVAQDGSLTKCKTTKEDPVGVGGAQAASRLVNAFQLSTWSADGRPVSGAAVNIDIVWSPPPDSVASKLPSRPIKSPSGRR